MYWLDTLILTLLVLGGAVGFFSGLLCQVARILTLAIALLSAIACNDTASFFFREHLLREADPRIAQAVAYVGIFLGVYLSLYLAARLLYQAIRALDLVMMDRLLGGLFGAGKMAMVLGACCLAAANNPYPLTRTWMAKSTLGTAFAGSMDHVLIRIPEGFKEKVFATLVSLQD